MCHYKISDAVLTTTKKHMATIEVDQSPSNNDLYEYRFL